MAEGGKSSNRKGATRNGIFLQSEEKMYYFNNFQLALIIKLHTHNKYPNSSEQYTKKKLKYHFPSKTN